MRSHPYSFRERLRETHPTFGEFPLMVPVRSGVSVGNAHGMEVAHYFAPNAVQRNDLDMRGMMLEATIILALSCVTSALAQGDSQDADLKKRLEEAEKRIGELEKKEQTESGVKVEFKDGLKLKTEDGNFNAHVGGRLLTHYRFVQDRPEGAGTRSMPDTFFVRQARLEISGDFYKDYEFKVQTDFPTGATSSTTGTLADGYLGWKKYPELSLRIGQFKEPFSQEETTSTRFIDFVERSVVNRLVPGRDIGLMIHGKLFEKILEYEAALYNGQGRAVVDGDDEKDTALRLRVTPFVNTENAALTNQSII